MNEPPPIEATGLKPLPKLAPRAPNQPAEGENPFTLPTTRGSPPPAEIPQKKESVPEKPLPAPAPPKDGLGARLLRSLRGGSSSLSKQPVPAETPAEAPAETPEKKGFSLPPARVIEPSQEPIVPPREKGPPRVEFEDAKPPRTVKSREPEEPKEVPAPFPEPSPRLEPGPPAYTESLLPSSAHESIPPLPPRAAPPAARTHAAAQTPKAADPRKSLVMIAAIAGAALGTVSVVAVYLLVRPDTAPGSPSPVVSPFGHPGRSTGAEPAVPAEAAPVPPAPAPQQSPEPLLEAPRPIVVPSPSGPVVPPVARLERAAPPPAPAPDASRHAATFADTPHLVVGGQEPKPKAKPAPPREEPIIRKPKGPKWTFEGVVFDLLTARGVFGAKLLFLDPEGKVVGETDTGPAGRYKVSLPAGSGYKLKISHGDYTDRYIDEGDATSSLREATPEERRILMSAAARNLPWTGDPAKPVHRDLALVPRTPEEP